MRNIIFALLIVLVGCNGNPLSTYSNLLVERGDIVVVSYNTDSLVVFSADGNLKRILYQVPTSADAISGLAWSEATNEILISIEGTPDRIEAVSSLTGISRSFYNNMLFFTGTIMGLGVLQNTSDVIASEGTTIERFNSSGIRKTSGVVWPTSVHANSNQLVGLSTGNWLSCSLAVGVKIFPDSTTSLAQVATVTGPVGALASYGCNELNNGSIVVGWNGAAADYIYVYNYLLASPTVIVNNVQSTISDPRGIAVGENNEIYVTDGAYNKVIELDINGTVVRQFGSSVLNNPRHVLVIPTFTP
jgi:hypothetical protein